MVLKCWYLPHTRRALARCATKLASLSGYTVTMTNFATDQIDTHIFAVTTAKRSAPLATTATFGYYFLAKTAASNCWFACLSHLATFGYYLLAKTAGLPFTSCHIWLLHLGQNSCKQQLLACLSPLAIFGYYILVKNSCKHQLLAFSLFFHICHNWLHHSQSSSKQQTGFAFILSSLPYLVTS